MKGRVKPNQASEAYQQVPSTVPDQYAMALNNLGVTYYNQGKTEQALELWETVSADIPEQYATAQMNLGMVYDSQGKLEQAIAAWERVPESLPGTLRFGTVQYRYFLCGAGQTDESSRGLGTYSCQCLRALRRSPIQHRAYLRRTGQY